MLYDFHGKEHIVKRDKKFKSLLLSPISSAVKKTWWSGWAITIRFISAVIREISGKRMIWWSGWVIMIKSVSAIIC